MKPTVGLVSPHGAVPINPLFDTLGPMAKNAVDLGTLLDVIADLGSKSVPRDLYARAARNTSWENLKIGVLNPEIWHQAPEMIKPVPGALEQACKEINAAYDKIQPLAKSFHRNIDVISPSALMVNGKNAMMESIGKKINYTLVLCFTRR